MNNEPGEAGRSPTSPGEEPPISFALNFISGRGLLSTRDRRLGGLELKLLELEIPSISFPFDVTGGSERFKPRRCLLRHLVFSLDADGLARALNRAALEQNGFVELRAALRDGHVELAGRFKVGESAADFTLRAAPVLRSPEELGVVFYDARVYGFLPIPAALIPVYLGRALGLPFVDTGRAGMWIIRPVEHFVRNTLPASGWKIPDTRAAHLVAAEVARGRISVAAGPESDPTQKQLFEREPPEEAVVASEGIMALTTAERALARGAVGEALQAFRDALEEGRGGRWARDRLLQLGAADPELAVDTRQLAEETLADDPKDVQALLALAALALREHSSGEASNRYATLAEIAHTRKERTDIVAAELAAAAAATTVDPAGALAAYERAAARARDSVVAHRALFDLRLVLGDWPGAIQAGERLLRLLTQPEAQAALHRELGKLQRVHLRDFKLARAHFERALRLTPDDPDALEGLAETYAARGEPGRAASYLARLAEQAESSKDKARIVALNLRLGDIWERWLADPAAAAARFYRVLDADPKNRKARLRLARLAEAKGELIRARALYEDILATEEDVADPEALPDIVATYTRLARVTFTASGPSAEAVACLERAVELDPRSRLARDELAKLLRLRGEWGRLVHLLSEGARAATDKEEARLARLAAARLEVTERHSGRAAEPYLAQLLDERADDEEALALLAPVLEERGDDEALLHRLYAAAEATREPERRAAWMWRIAELRRDTPAAYSYLTAALDAHPYLLGAADDLVAHCKKLGTPEQRAHAYGRLAVAARDRAARARALALAATILADDLGRPREAEAALREAALYAPEDVDIWLGLAKLQEDAGQLAAARVALERALPSLSGNTRSRAVVHARLSELARRMGDVEAQAQHLLAALASGADAEELRPRLSQVLSSLGRKDQLAELLETWAANAEGASADGFRLEAAAVRESMGDGQRALELYRAVLLDKRDAAVEAARHLERLALERSDWAAMVKAVSYQLETAAPADVKLLLAKLVRAQDAAGDGPGVEVSAQRLLELDPKSTLAHRSLAEHHERTGAFREALEHWLALIYEGKVDARDRTARRQAFERAAALALEVGTEHVQRLQGSFDREFPEAPPSVVSRPLGEALAEKGAWEELLSLRRFQLETAGRAAKPEWRRDVAEILHRRLGRSAEAVPFYQDVIAHQPEDLEARTTLIELLGALGKDADLANLLFALSQLLGDGHDALAAGLKSVEVYAQKLGDETSALQVLHLCCARADVDPDSPDLHAALRQYHLVDEQANLLERSIGQSPDPDDGRFAELVGLLAGPLADVPRAVAWCERMIEAFPASDRPRELVTRLLKTNPRLGDVAGALRAWADARSGSARAAVLLELGKHLLAAAQLDEGVAALEQAAEVDPQNEAVLEQLVDRATASGDFARALRWLERLARAQEPGPRQDELLRRVVQTATDYADDPAAAARSLLALTRRSEIEARTMIELLADERMLDDLASLAGTAPSMPPDLALRAGAALAAGGVLEPARVFLDQALARGDRAAVWAAADSAWRAAGKLEELGKWRLQSARQYPGAEAGAQRLLGYADLVESGRPAAEVLSPTMFDTLARETDLSRPAAAWALFRAAHVLQQETWLERAMAALVESLPEDDPRLVQVLRARLDRELAARRFDGALALAERLLVLGDERADEWMERVLTAWGRRDELVRYLLGRAESAGEHGGPLWMRIADHYAGAADWKHAAAALERVAVEQRHLRWGELMARVGRELDDAAREAAGATVCASVAEGSNARAEWLRRAARLWWWQLDDERRGRAMLREAQGFVPVTTAEAKADVEAALAAHGRPVAQRVLAEALAVLDGPDATPLWLLEARLASESNDKPRALEALARALELAPEQAPLLGELAVVARQLGRYESAVTALRRATALDVSYEDRFLAALQEAGGYAEAADVLEASAARLEPQPAATRLEAAARLAVVRLGVPERGLALLERAVSLSPAPATVAAAFDLSVELGRTAVTAGLGALLLERLSPNASERPAALRAYTDALDAESRVAESLAAREELLLRRLATAKDKLELGRLLAASDAERAALLLEQAALDPAYEAEPALLIEAAGLWERQGQLDRARALVRDALARGVQELDAHALAVRVLEGPERVGSMARLIEARADGDWPAAERAAGRVEVAAAVIARGRPDRALTLLRDAHDLGRAPGWTVTMERALAALRKDAELASFWVDEIEAGGTPWTPEEQRSRLDRAASTWREAGDATHELRALDAILRLDPADEATAARIADLAVALGDAARYLANAKGRLARAVDPTVRRQLATEIAERLLGDFNDPTAAADVVAPALAAHPSLALAQVLERALTAAGRGDDLAAAIVQAAEAAEPPERAALWVRAAELAAAAGSAPDAYAHYRQALADDPGLEAARDFCIMYAETNARWGEAAELLERAAALPTGERQSLLMRASRIVRDHLASPDRELALLRAALEVDPTAGEVAERVARLHLERGELDPALEVLVAGNVPWAAELELAPDLVQDLEGSGREAEAERVMEWLVQRHPEAPESADYRLTLARKHGDAAAVLAEVTERLRAESDLRPADVARLRLEAARAALSLHDEGAAAGQLREVIRGAGDDVDVLFGAWRLIAEWGEPDLLREAGEQATAVRDDIFARAAAAKGAERVRWLELLGCAHEAAGDDAGAVGAFSQLLVLEPTRPSSLALRALERLYTRSGDTARLVALHEQMAASTTSAAERTSALVRAATFARDGLADAARATALFEQALAADPASGEARLGLGLLLHAAGKHAEALPHLTSQVHDDAPLEQLLALADCCEAEGDLSRAIDTIDKAILGEAARPDLYLRQAELYERAGDASQSEAAWMRYVAVLGPNGPGPQIGAAYQRLAALARRRTDLAAAIDFLERARRLDPDSPALMADLRGLYEATERFSDAAELRLREAAVATSPAGQAEHFRALAGIYEHHLDDAIMAAAMLEKASELVPDDAALLETLVKLHEATGNWPQYVVAAERLAKVVPERRRSIAFLEKLAVAYEEAGDLLRAKEAVDEGLALEPRNPELRARQRSLAQATGDYRGYAEAEEADLQSELPAPEKVSRLTALADVYVKHLTDPARAASTLERARALDPGEPTLARRLGDLYALEAGTYSKAAEVYRSLLAENPLDADLLRILARLSGQVGDTDRAYGYYAALMVLVSGDTEAQRFVTACRAARPIGPQRALTDADRAAGLVHPGQMSPLEEVFTPLARFAELTHPGDLGRRGVSPSDLLAQGDPRRQNLAKVLDPLGSGQAAVYVWKAGAFACELEIVNPPAVLIGMMLAGDAPDRQRAFLVARAAELFRSGHGLCEKLSTTDLSGLIAALCLAVAPQETPPGATRDTQRWAQVAGAPLTSQIRGVMAPRVQAYLRASPTPDIGEWRRGCLSSASRTAMLVACDVEEALAALLKLRGFDDIDDDQRTALLREAPEELDLLRFAVSEPYFKLRQALGLALRRSK